MTGLNGKGFQKVWNRKRLQNLAERLEEVSERVGNHESEFQSYIDSAIRNISENIDEIQLMHKMGIKEYERHKAMERWADPNIDDL